MNESLQAAIDAVEASNPTPAADVPPKADETAVEKPASEQGNDAATEQHGQQASQSEESEESAASDGEDAPAQRQNKGVGKRINELTREKYEALRRAEAAERRAQELEAKSNPQHKDRAEPGQGDGKPKIEDFNFDHEAYVEALTDWRFNQKLAERENYAKEQQRHAQDQERAQQFHERLSAYQTANPGKWEAATQAPVNFTPPMLEVIATSDIGPQIAVYLTENLDRADEISRMTPIAAAAALGRLEASMAAPKASATPPKPTSVTKAPPPPSTVGGGAVVRKDLASMDVSDHLEAVRANRNR
jgi:hypothetical protein